MHGVCNFGLLIYVCTIVCTLSVAVRYPGTKAKWNQTSFEAVKGITSPFSDQDSVEMKRRVTRPDSVMDMKLFWIWCYALLRITLFVCWWNYRSYLRLRW